MDKKKHIFLLGFLSGAIVLGVIFSAYVIVRDRTDTKSLAQECIPVSTTGKNSKNQLAIGTFPCATPTPIPPTLTPAPTNAPGVTSAPPTQNAGTAPAPQTPLPPIDKDYQDPDCPPGQAHGITRQGVLVGVFKPGTTLGPGDHLDVCEVVPVIYLYPTKDTSVHVQVFTNGYIYNSMPQYPENGWQNILSHPDGSLFYKNQTYNSLLYETVVPLIKSPELSYGIIIPVANLSQTLNSVMRAYGLNQKERQDFLDEWVPLLQKLQKPYIYFSLYDLKTKNIFDKLTITPQPDTEIYFSAYFKPLLTPFEIPYHPLVLPSKPIERTGFTITEWGALIDY